MLVHPLLASLARYQRPLDQTLLRDPTIPPIGYPERTIPDIGFRYQQPVDQPVNLQPRQLIPENQNPFFRPPFRPPGRAIGLRRRVMYGQQFPVHSPNIYHRMIV